MSVSLNSTAVTYAWRLVQDGKVSREAGSWQDHNPDAAQENTFLDQHEMGEYGNWHLGPDMGQNEDAKGRYRFPYGDFQAVHRSGLVAARERAARQGYTDVENAPAELLQLLDEGAWTTALARGRPRPRAVGACCALASCTEATAS